MKLETEKLAAILGGNARVDRAAVEAYVAKDTEYKIYELTQAASRRNFALFSEILADMLEKGSDEHAVLAALVSHYRTLAEVSGMAGSDAEVAKTLGVKPYAVQKNREAARTSARRACRRCIFRSMSSLRAQRAGSTAKRARFSRRSQKYFSVDAK